MPEELPEGHYKLECPHGCGWAIGAPLELKDVKGGHVDVVTPETVQEAIQQHLMDVHNHPR